MSEEKERYEVTIDGTTGKVESQRIQIPCNCLHTSHNLFLTLEIEDMDKDYPMLSILTCNGESSLSERIRVAWKILLYGTGAECLTEIVIFKSDHILQLSDFLLRCVDAFGKKEKRDG